MQLRVANYREWVYAVGVDLVRGEMVRRIAIAILLGAGAFVALVLLAGLIGVVAGGAAVSRGHAGSAVQPRLLATKQVFARAWKPYGVWAHGASCSPVQPGPVGPLQGCDYSVGGFHVEVGFGYRTTPHQAGDIVIYGYRDPADVRHWRFLLALLPPHSRREACRMIAHTVGTGPAHA